MRRLLMALCLLTTLPALAGTLTLTTTTARDTRLARATARANKLTCGRWALPATCTQAQARKAYCTQQGAGAVMDCAGATSIDVYATGQDWAQAKMNALIDDYGGRADKDDLSLFESAATAATKAQKDAACQALGLAAGCLP